MISTNAYYHTFFIKAAQYGTAFTIDIAEQEYLVTARHLTDPTVEEFELQIFFNGSWLTRSAVVIGRGRGDIDIAVLKLAKRLTNQEFKFTPSKGGFFFGQDVFFMGFPYKLWGDVGTLFEGRPAAFVKKGTLSFISPSEIREFYVDAINNEGFSGAPLFFYPPNDPNDIHVIAVVSKFRTEYEPVLNAESEPTEMKIAYNTGFLVAYGITHVLDIIQSQ